MMRLAIFVLTAILAGSTPAWSQAETWSLVPELRIDGTAVRPRGLSAVRGIALGPLGQIFVGQPAERLVRVFDAAGREIRTIGGPADSPGSFSDVMGPPGFLGDTLYVADDKLGQVSLFSTDGKFIGAVLQSLPELDERYRSTAPRRMLPDGTALMTPFPAGPVEVMADVDRIPVLRLSRGGSVIDTLTWVPTDNDFIVIQRRGLRLITGQPFTDAPVLSFSPSGQHIVIAERAVADERLPARFRVTRLLASGDTAYSREYPYTPIPTPKALVDSVIAARARGMAQSPMFESVEEASSALREAIVIPSALSPIGEVVVAQDGSVWLRREDRPGETVTWKILDPQGELRATLEAPEGTSIRVVDGDTVWAVESDAHGTVRLVRYGIQRSRSQSALRGPHRPQPRTVPR